MSNLDMVPHDPSPLFEGYAVPFALLCERIYEKMLRSCRLGIARLAKILGWPEHGEIGVGCREILSELSVQELRV